MTRLGTLAATIGAAGAVGALSAGVPLLTGPFIVLALVGILLGRVARCVAPDGAWTSPRGIDRSATATATSGDRPPGRRVARALGRVEARELALHPWFGVGIGLCAFMAVDFGLAGDAEGAWADELQGLTFLAHPLVGMAVLAGHAAATRAQRAGTVELFEACPAAPSTRTLGALGSMWVPPAALGVFFAAYVTSTAIAYPELTEPTGPAALHVASGLTLGAGGVALGVAVGRFFRSMLAPVVAIVVVGFVSLRLAEGTGDQVNPAMVLSTFPPVGESTALLTTGHMAWHLLWLLGLTAATAAVAALRPHRTSTRPYATLVHAGAGA